MSRTKVLIVTLWDETEYRSHFFKAGASGYLLKQAMGSELVSAIRAVNGRGIYAGLSGK